MKRILNPIVPSIYSEKKVSSVPSNRNYAMVNLLFYGGAFWLACIVFTVDLIVPSGVAVGLGYVVVVNVGIWFPLRKYFFLRLSLERY